MWGDIAMIVFAVTAANHMGLIAAAEKIAGFKFPIVNCCKCGSFWISLIFGLIDFRSIGLIPIVAISFFAAWSAVWVELLMGYIDILYAKTYDRIYNSPTIAKTNSDTENNAEGDS